jgi:transcriptional regulator with XRE-family HTH domain
MAIKARDYIATLPESEQQAIKVHAEELIAEEMTLRELRKARRRSQVEIARKLKINQAAVSRLERRADMYLSTLRKLVKAMGGSVEIIAEFPDRPPVRIRNFKSLKVRDRA